MRAFFTRHWIWLHAAVAILVPGFLALGAWQVARAGAGNARSYGYAVEWPSLAAIAIFLYIRAIRMELRSARMPVPVAPPHDEHVNAVGYDVPIVDAEDDPELAAYNEYLGDLHARDLQKRP